MLVSNARVVVLLVAAAAVACSAAEEREERGFRPVDGPTHVRPSGSVKAARDGYGLFLFVKIMTNPEFYLCNRLTIDACTVTTCTWAANGTPDIQNVGVVDISWASQTFNVGIENEESYELESASPWQPGEPIQVTGQLDAAPPFDEELAAPPLLTLTEPKLSPGFSAGAPDAAGIWVDTSRALTFAWTSPPTANSATVTATLICSDRKVGESTEVHCMGQVATGALVIPASTLHYLPTEGCSNGSYVELLAGDFRELALPSWRYELAVTQTAQTADGVDASAAITIR